MSIRPIDMAMMPNKSQEVSQIQSAANQKQTHAQEQLGVQYNQNIRHNSQQTVKATKGENNEYRYDAKEKGNNSFSNNKRKKGKQKKEKENDKKSIGMSNLDIRI